MELKGNAVVTGANGSLGRAFCRALQAQGWSVVGVDIEGTDVRLDVTDPEACRRLAREADPQVWVNAAGVSVGGPAIDQQDSEVARMVAVNLMGTVNGTRAAVEAMRPRHRGHVLNLGSLAAWMPVPGGAVESATMHAVRAFSVAVGLELEGTGVHVSTLCSDRAGSPLVVGQGLSGPALPGGRRALSADEVARRGMEVLERPSLVVTVPTLPGLQARLAGLAPSLTHALRRLAERRRPGAGVSGSGADQTLQWRRAAIPAPGRQLDP